MRGGAAVVDAELVLRAQGGDSEAFGQLVGRHEHALLAIARAHFASEADARDAVQEAFLKAFKALGRLQDSQRFAAWLATIAVNTCRDILRSFSDKVSLTEFSSTASLRPRLGQEYLTPSSLSSKSEEAELVRIAIGRLPEEQRIVLMLRYVEHMTYEGAAAYLDVPPSTVRGRLYHAKRALRGLLEDGIHPGD
jgi:RNA polymerase sigma-70 factor (ECF subfamily)